MDAFLGLTFVLIAQTSASKADIPATPTSPIAVPVVVPSVSPNVNVVKAPPTPMRCDARPYQRLVGRTVGDLMTARLPQGTRVYRLDDPPLVAVVAGRLSVELNRSTRVRRVYCS